jgi:hypothetical protein
MELVDQDLLYAISSRIDLPEPNALAVESLAAELSQYLDVDQRPAPFEGVIGETDLRQAKDDWVALVTTVGARRLGRPGGASPSVPVAEHGGDPALYLMATRPKRDASHLAQDDRDPAACDRARTLRKLPRLAFRIAMFFSSYAPLFGLLAYKNRSCEAAWVTLAGVAGLSIVGLVIVMLSQRSEVGPQLVVAHSRPKDGDVLAYVATYLVPFLSVDLTKRDDIVLFCGFLLVLMVVYVNSNMLFVNPLLSVVGYHSFDVADPDGHEYSLIARRKDLDPGIVITPSQIDRYIRVEVSRGSPGSASGTR